MLKIEKFVTASPEQWEIILEGMRNPKNSWDLMDSEMVYGDPYCPADSYDIGPKDHKLAMSLADGGPVHAKYRRMIPVWITMTAPLYWWKEFDTYKIGTVSNSCSTMHKIQAKEFTMDDFSTEHLFGVHDFHTFEPLEKYFPKFEEWDGNEKFWTPMAILEQTIKGLNFYRERFLDTQARLKSDVRVTGEDRRNLNVMAILYWWQMIQMLPTPYNQKRTISLNYEVLHGIYIWRKDHKLDEWHTFCDWIRELPYSELITMEDDK